MEYNKSHEVERYRRLCLYCGFNTYKKSKKFLESGFIIIIYFFPSNANTLLNFLLLQTRFLIRRIQLIQFIWYEIKIIVHFILVSITSIRAESTRKYYKFKIINHKSHGLEGIELKLRSKYEQIWSHSCHVFQILIHNFFRATRRSFTIPIVQTCARLELGSGICHVCNLFKSN